MSPWAWLVRIATTAPCLGCDGRVRLRRPFGTRVAAYCDRCLERMRDLNLGAWGHSTCYVCGGWFSAAGPCESVSLCDGCKGRHGLAEVPRG